MLYNQFQPHVKLTPYIDAYWTVTGDSNGLKTERILPDGCIDIILNVGADCKTDNESFVMKNEGVYLVGTMTRFKETLMPSETKLIGIRFKPAAFPFFYRYDDLHQLTNQTVEFEKALSPDLKKTIQHTVAYLDHFFLTKWATPKHSLLPIVADIQDHRGQINVSTLAQRHFTTDKQLERNFKRYIGTSPKEFINLVRYQFAMRKIQQNTAARSLLDIAFECGYYDHAHLTNEIKKYTGVVPSLM